MSDIIDLTQHRNEREQPDAEFVRRDDLGRPLYCFALDYAFNDRHWSAEVWACSMEEAQQRVDAMREGLTLRGQMFTRFPA